MGQKELIAFRTKGDGGPRNRAAPQHRYERQNFAECGELLRNASILMTLNQQSKHGVARCGGLG